MTNPFQLKHPPHLPNHQPNQPIGRVGLIIGTIVVAVVLIVLAKETGLLPGSFRTLFSGGDAGGLYVSQGDLTQEQARALYRESLEALQNNEYDVALNGFKRLEAAYPGMKDMLWLHEAEAYGGQGNEWAVQKKLSTLRDQLSGSPLRTLALYRIGQSQFRGNERDKAQTTFSDIRSNYASSPYAIGSLYYLGALQAKNPKTADMAVVSLSGYLQQCPDCKFSVDAAQALNQLRPFPTAEEHALIGDANAIAGKSNEATLLHLQTGIRSMTWLSLGKTWLRLDKTQNGLQTLVAGIGNAKTLDEAKEAIDLVVAHSASDPAKKSALQSIIRNRYQLGGDYALWKLATVDPDNAPASYRQLVEIYPKSDYAPESTWQLLWPLIQQNRNAEYLSLAQRFMGQYAYARSAPKVLFWMAKLQEKSSAIQATQIYTRIRDQFPMSYYAFRSSGRLAVMTAGKPDPGWRTEPGETDYAAVRYNLNTLDIIPSADVLGSNGDGVRSEGLELQRIGAAEDVRVLIAEAVGKIPPAVESWADQASGDKANGIRVMRDALDAEFKAGMLAHASDPTTYRQTLNPEQLKLIYPVYFQASITPAAQKNNLDPFLIQALSREESYFNEFAISTSNARGLMQLLPSTAGDVAKWENLSAFKTADLFNPQINIQLGARYLGHLHQIFKGNSMPSVGAYNGGPGAMQKWVTQNPDFANDPDRFVESIPYGQSRDYIKKVFAGYWNYSRLYRHE